MGAPSAQPGRAFCLLTAAEQQRLPRSFVFKWAAVETDQRTQIPGRPRFLETRERSDLFVIGVGSGFTLERFGGGGCGFGMDPTNARPIAGRW